MIILYIQMFSNKMSATNKITAAAATDTNAGLSSSVTGQMTVAIVLLIAVLMIVVLILYLRSKEYAGTVYGSSRRSGRLVFAPHEPASARNALDRSILDSLPVTAYQTPKDDECGLDCAVCLCELADEEEARFLPKCDHVFHVECIDMWFGSNSTCPLCRLPVEAYSSGVSPSCGRRELVTEIPRRGVEEGFTSAFSLPLSSRRTVEGVKSPVLEKLRSLGRMMSRGKGKGVGSSCTPRPVGDIEHGSIGYSKNQYLPMIRAELNPIIGKVQ